MDARPTTGVMYHYCGSSSTPVEDGVLLAPFDCPQNLAKNIEAGQIVGVDAKIHDARLDDELMGKATDKTTMETLDTRGFLLQSHTSAMTDFWDQQSILDVHYPEMQRFSEKLTGCNRTAVAAHALRGGVTAMGRPAAYFVHNDFSDRLKPLYQELIAAGEKNVITDPVDEGGMGLTSDEFNRGRLAVMNYWRPMQREPLQRNHMAIIDSTSMQGDDIVQFPHYMSQNQAFGSFSKHFRIPTNPHVNVGNRPNPNHKWFYFPGMTCDEVMAFKNYDSEEKQPGNGIGMHTSFDDPNTPESAPTRESIEIRVVCFWFADAEK